MMDRAQQKIFRGNKVRVKDIDEFPLGSLQPFRQRACLETLAVGAMVLGNWVSSCRVLLHQATGDGLSFVS
jgi:hypothetical protein